MGCCGATAALKREGVGYWAGPLLSCQPQSAVKCALALPCFSCIVLSSSCPRLNARVPTRADDSRQAPQDAGRTTASRSPSGLSRWSLPYRPESVSPAPDPAPNPSYAATPLRAPLSTPLAAGWPGAGSVAAGGSSYVSSPPQSRGRGTPSPVSPRSVRSDDGRARNGDAGRLERIGAVGRRRGSDDGAARASAASVRPTESQQPNGKAWAGDPDDAPLTEADRTAALRAAAVTVLPAGERSAALRSMGAEERAATLRWMDPADVPARLRPGGPGPLAAAAAVERSLRRGDIAAVAAALQRVEDVDEVRQLVSAMAPGQRREVLGRLPMRWHEALLARMDADGVAEALAGMDPPQAHVILQALPAARRAAVRSAMAARAGPASSAAGAPDGQRTSGTIAAKGGGDGGGSGILDLSWLTSTVMRPVQTGPAY